MPPSTPKPARPRFSVTYVIIAVLALMLLHDVWNRTQTVAPLPYSQFQKLLSEKKVEEVMVVGNEIRGTLKEADPALGGKKQFVTNRVETDLADQLGKQGIKYAAQPQSTLVGAILYWIMPLLLFVGVWLFIIRRAAGKLGPGGGLMAIGKSKAKVYVETDVKVTFKDVAGVDEAKHELEEVVSFLKDPQKHGRLGARMPKGVLLVGPPGTGKTLLAKAVAGEAEVPFFSISGSEFVEMFVGVGAARVRDLFKQAREASPCIVFLDEIDAVGRKRGTGLGGGHDEREQA